MSEIYVKVVRFNFKTQAELDNFINARRADGMHPFYESRHIVRPVDGDYLVIARDCDYVTVDSLQVLHDLVICCAPAGLSGYSLELPPGCRPAERDPAQDVASDGAPVSKLRQAVLYMIEHGTSANAAARHFGIAASNMGPTIRHMRERGEI